MFNIFCKFGNQQVLLPGCRFALLAQMQIN